MPLDISSYFADIGYVIFSVDNILDTLSQLYKAQQKAARTEATFSPVPTVAPPARLVGPDMEHGIMSNVSYKCRPDPAFPKGDLVSAYAGLLITFIMAIYARCAQVISLGVVN